MTEALVLRSRPTTVDHLAIPGPVVVLGASGFIGAHVLEHLSLGRTDVVGTGTSTSPWRLRDLDVDYRPASGDAVIDLLDDVRPRTIVNLAASGAYSFQVDADAMAATNVTMVERLANWAAEHGAAIVHAGSSSEYGANSAGPNEEDRPEPNSVYAVTKLAGTNLLAHHASRGELRARVLRFYSIYGPLEDPSRLVPEIVRRARNHELPSFAARETSRDFVHIDDAVDAVLLAARSLADPAAPEFRVYNVASGKPTSMVQVARAVTSTFGIDGPPTFSQVQRAWDLPNWFGDAQRARSELGWRATTRFADGLRRTYDWYDVGDRATLLEERLSARAPATKVSAVIACYKDGQAIPYMHERLTKAFVAAGVDYEIIFVNDASPDDSAEVIRELSASDPHVIGVTHRRNFGSQAAFLSGMREASGDAVVLLDGDLQDPPELIPVFIERWREGNEIVYGRRTDRDAPWFMRIAYKAFYRLFNRSASFHVPTDAGDFSLLDRRVVDHLLAFPERDVFLRALRGYVGGQQVGVDYKRPERMFGRSTNNLRKNIGWAIKGILAVSRVPLSLLATFSFFFFLLCSVALVVQVIVKIANPDSAPQGTTLLILLVVFLGSLNLLAISIVGAYIGTILEETKRRPRYLRDSVTRGGVIRRS